MEHVRDLEGQEVWSCAGDVLGNLGLECRVRLVRILFFNQPLHRHTRIDDNVRAHAHDSISASRISRASRIKSAELPGSGLSPNSSCRSSANSSWSGLLDHELNPPLASSLVSSLIDGGLTVPAHADAFERGDDFQSALKGGIEIQCESLPFGFHRPTPSPRWPHQRTVA